MKKIQILEPEKDLLVDITNWLEPWFAIGEGGNGSDWRRLTSVGGAFAKQREAWSFGKWFWKHGIEPCRRTSLIRRRIRDEKIE